jgi:hypothetical protein
MFWLVMQAGNATFGWRFFVYDCHQAEIGHEQAHGSQKMRFGE